MGSRGELVGQENHPAQQHHEGGQTRHQKGTTDLLSVWLEGNRQRRGEGNALLAHHRVVIPDHGDGDAHAGGQVQDSRSDEWVEGGVLSQNSQVRVPESEDDGGSPQEA